MNAEDKVFKNIDIKFSINSFMFHAVNISSTTMVRNIPLHSHGVGCYEVHYISHGHGFLKVNGAEYELTPNTLYITGPLVPHSQFTDKNDPMHEYGIYLKTDETARSESNDIISAFLSQDFWAGTDDTVRKAVLGTGKPLRWLYGNASAVIFRSCYFNCKELHKKLAVQKRIFIKYI